MAYGDSGSDDELYTDGPERSAAPEKKEEGESGQTALLPKSILMGKDFKVGDEVVLKITGMHDDELSVTYAPEKKEEPSAPSAAEPDADPELSSMME